MASGSYAKRHHGDEEEGQQIPSQIPRRATRFLTSEHYADEVGNPQVVTQELFVSTASHAVPSRLSQPAAPRRKSPIYPFLIFVLLVFLTVTGLWMLGILPPTSSRETGVIATSGGNISVQVGGSLQKVTVWENTNGPKSIPIHHSSGPYSVIGKPTITAEFINRVLAAYQSPAAGKGQALFNLGVKYGIDPAFALAFFLHESTFGKYGMATTTLSLGNLRCIPNYPCVNNYASFSSWEQGFEEWYKLIRNLYVAVWGKTTVAEIIPTYAPASDHNDEAAYIAAVKHSIDTWHAGQLIVS